MKTKPSLNKHVITHKTNKEIKQRQNWKQKRKKSLKENTSKQKLLGLIFDHSPQSNLSQTNKNAISNIKIQRSRPENALIKKKLTRGCFVKKLPLWFTISSES